MTLPRFSNVKKLKYPGFSIVGLFNELASMDDGQGGAIFLIPAVFFLVIGFPLVLAIIAFFEIINLLAYPIAFILDLLNFIPGVNLDLYRPTKYGGWDHKLQERTVIEAGYINWIAIVIYVIFLYLILNRYGILDVQSGGRRRR